MISSMHKFRLNVLRIKSQPKKSMANQILPPKIWLVSDGIFSFLQKFISKNNVQFTWEVIFDLAS